MTFKRRYQADDDFQIDLPFLINQSRALSEREFRICLPELSYEEYLKTFLRRRITDLFQEYKDAEWFKCRYLEKHDRASSISGSLSNVIVSRNMNLNPSIVEYLKNSSNIKSFTTSQNSKMNNFTVDLYIIPVSSSINEQVTTVLKEAGCTDIQIHDLSKVPYRNKAFCTISQLKDLISLFCLLCGFDEVSITDEFKGSESIAKCLLILQKKFNFDPVSCKQYDSNIALLDYLKNHDSNDSLCERSLDILGHSNIFKTIFSRDSNCESFYSETLEKNFKCNACEKIFETKEFMIHHIQKKHQNFWYDLTRDNLEMARFFEQIDFFFLIMCLGIEDSSVPTFFKDNFPTNPVVYDMPCIFSGQL